jgi:hypothetical protein
LHRAPSARKAIDARSGCGALIIATLEGEQSLLDLSKIGEVVGCEDLALNHPDG